MTQGFHDKNGSFYADNVSLTSIARDVGTPAYVYCASVIRQQHALLTDAFKRNLPAGRQPKLFFACKANTGRAVLSVLHGLGTGLEIVSEGELARGLAAGFNGSQIISTSFGKMDSEIRACLSAGIRQFNIESLPELEHVNRVAAEMGKIAPVLFRLNPNISGGGHHKISTGRKRDKFGLGAERILEAYAMADMLPNVEPLGVSVHIGSQVSQVEAFKPAFEALADMVRTLRARGHKVTRLDIGGGFPIIYNDEQLLDLDAYARWVNESIVPLDTEIQMEPGRYLVGNSGVLLSEVVYVKETQDRTFLVLDAAMNDLIRPTLYDAYHRISPLENRQRAVKTYDVVGPICESGDTFAHEREIAELRQGEFVAIETAGAYGIAMASNYNSRSLPVEVMVDGDRYAIIRKRQDIEDIMAGETLPPWL